VNTNSIGVQALHDCWAAFNSKDTDRLSSEEIVEYLIGLEDRPWAEWKGGRPLTKNGLSRLLEPFGIHPVGVRIGTKTPRGYYLAAFEDAVRRYLPPQTATSQQANSGGENLCVESATTAHTVAVGKSSKPNNDGLCCDVAVENPVEEPLHANGAATFLRRRPPRLGAPALGPPGDDLSDMLPEDWS
jgi:hypothetical protein